MRRVLVLAVALSTLLGFPGMPASAVDTGLIRGTVTDVEGNPLADVVVVVQRAGGADAVTAKSAADGSFEVVGLSAWAYDVCFDASEAVGGTSSWGYAPRCWKDVYWPVTEWLDNGATLVRLSAGGVVTGVDQSFEPAGAMTGTVTDAGGAPLSGAVVTVPNTHPSRSVVTDLDGQYEIQGLPAGDHTVCVTNERTLGGLSSAGYLDQCYRGYEAVTVVAGEATRLDNIMLGAASELAGAVTDRDGRPLAGIPIFARGVADGHEIVATDLTDEAGRYAVSVEGLGYDPTQPRQRDRLPAAAYELWLNGAPPIQGDVEAWAAHHVHSAYVTTAYENVTAAFGAVWTGTPTPVTLSAGARTTVDVALDEAGSIGGVLRDLAGQPIPNVAVIVAHGAHSTATTTDASGHYLVRGLPEATYTVCFGQDDVAGGNPPAATEEGSFVSSCYATAGDDSSGGTPFALGYGEDRSDVDWTMAWGSGIRGRMTGPDGQGVAFAHVVLYPSNKTWWATDTHADEDGYFELRALKPGDYHVYFYDPWTENRRWYDGAGGVPTRAESTPVTAVPGRIVTHIDAWEGAQPPVVTPPVDPTPPPPSPTAMVSTSAPRISGTVRVGLRLTASPGGWTPAGSYAYQWLAGGVSIVGATGATYTPSTSVFGKRLSVRVTASRPGYATATATSLSTVAVRPGTITAVTLPTITGTVRVGLRLTASSGGWTPAGSYAYQWLANEVAIHGATSATYTPGASVLGKRLAVRVTASHPGYATATATSSSTVAVRPGTITAVTLPRITGKRQAGHRLTATTGTWRPGGLIFTYQWLRDGKRIKHARGHSYLLPRGSRKHRISVRVTATRPGYAPSSQTSRRTVRVS